MEALSLSIDFVSIAILCGLFVQFLLRELRSRGCLSGDDSWGSSFSGRGWMSGTFEKRSLLNQMVAPR